MEEKNMIHFLKRLNYHKDASIIWGWSNDGVEREHQFYFIYISFVMMIKNPDNLY